MANDVLYHEVAEIIRSVLAKEQSLRNAVYGNSYKNKKSLLRLSCETLRFRPLFDEILKDPQLAEILSDPALDGDTNLAYVLLYEFLAGAGLGRSSPRLRGVICKHTKTIHDREKELANEGRGVAALKEGGDTSETSVAIPRYARINTLKWTAEEALEKLAYEDWKVVHLSTQDDFAKRVGSIADDEVLVDPHVENLLIFPHSNEFHRYWLVEQRYLILQDKASCLPAFLLAPTPGSHVFDTCAAPGMKTSHVSAMLGGEGKIWAMDRSEERVETMKKILEECKVENASVFVGDFLKTDVNDKKFAKVRYAIVDPPCSGSGMVKRMDEITGGNAQPERLAKLKNLQAMILKHTLKFPNLQRAVYSTCSIHEEENEQVVDEVLLDTYVRQHFRLAPSPLPIWTQRGLDSYAFGADCLRADPAKTLTNGFFVAVFERIPEGGHAADNVFERKKKRKNLEESTEDTNSVNNSLNKKNKHKKFDEELEDDIECSRELRGSEETVAETEVHSEKKKKKHKKKRKDSKE